jgi:hypothetical protein
MQYFTNIMQKFQALKSDRGNLLFKYAL